MGLVLRVTLRKIGFLSGKFGDFRYPTKGNIRGKKKKRSRSGDQVRLIIVLA